MRGAEHVESVIAERQSLLDEDVDRLDLYGELYELYSNARARDEAWCVARTLVFLQRADRAQKRLYEDHRRRGPIRPKSRLDDERWLKDVAHPSQDLLVSKIFQTVWPAILSLRGKRDRDAGLAAKYQVDPATHTGTFPKTFAFVAHVLGMQTPRLFLRPDVQGGVTHLPVYPLGSLCGATLLQGFEPADLIFIAGRHLSDYRGEHYIRTLMPSFTELKTVLVAALRIANLAPADPQIDAVALEIRGKLAPQSLDVLSVLARRLVQTEREVDLIRWLQSVELTACRAGFLVADDLDVAARMLRALGASGPVDLRPKEKLRELVRFSVSEEYFRLRAALGIQLRYG
jgi:hypothetical protein